MDLPTCDLLLIPTTVYPPPKIHPSLTTIDPTEMFANDIMTIPISLTGYPAIYQYPLKVVHGIIIMIHMKRSKK
jgi:Asp-tRNA(Asn)/Glu-tRNA(Gln) amidotransferase A subunit family amidase